MILGVASGKGGTGKTTVCVNLAGTLECPVLLLDCDVEEPNDHLFLHPRMKERDVVGIPIPEIDESRCDGCGECGRFCQYHAIVSLGTKPLLFPDLCHGCGGCMRVCPREAIHETSRRIGVVETGIAGRITLVQGRLDVGVAMAPPLIRNVKGRLKEHSWAAAPGVAQGVAILDAPPGTSCPVVTTLMGTDFVLLVTEPTAFGLHDLGLMVDVVRSLEIPFGVLVNRAGGGDGRVHSYCAREDIPILAEIPDDRRIAECYSRGRLIVDALPEFRPLYGGLMDKVAETMRAMRS